MPKRPTYRLVFSFVITVLVLIGCKRDGETPPEGPEVAVSEVTLKAVDDKGLKQIISESKAKVKLVNFWATWCVPCKKEFPDLIQIGKDFAEEGVEVVFVSADYKPDWPKAQDFLEQHGITGVSYMTDPTDASFMQRFHESWYGSLPATFLYDETGTMKDFWEGMATYEQIKERVTKVLAS